jgi:hypothetical protein
MKFSRVLIGLLVFWSAAGAVAQRTIYRNRQYGIFLPVPSGTLACIPPVYKGNGADHGPQILLGTDDATLCAKSSGKRYINVFASYTVTEEEKTLHGNLEMACEFEVNRACSPAPAGLHIKGMKTEAGRLDRSDGSIEIILVTMAGKPAPDFDASVPSINYSLSLNTDKQHLDEDLTAFRAMLKTIKIAPASHSRILGPTA